MRENNKTKKENTMTKDNDSFVAAAKEIAQMKTSDFLLEIGEIVEMNDKNFLEVLKEVKSIIDENIKMTEFEVEEADEDCDW